VTALRTSLFATAVPTLVNSAPPVPTMISRTPRAASSWPLASCGANRS
jgi:hypothetical protein